MEFLPLINFYFVVALVVMNINAFLAGYHGVRITMDDVIQSVVWPISIAALLGTLVRIGVESYKEESRKVTKKKETK